MNFLSCAVDLTGRMREASVRARPFGIGAVLAEQRSPVPHDQTGLSFTGKTVLENGVRVVTEAIDGVRSVSIGVLLDCGSKDETEEEAGLAHLCEHLVFQGTGGRDALEIARQIDSFGHVGGFTTRDYTCHFAATLNEYQFHALDLLGDVLLNPTLPEECVARERSAVLSEIERCLDMPDRRVHELAKQQAWPGSALGRPIAGSPESVSRHTREDAIYFLARTPPQQRTKTPGRGWRSRS